MTAPETRRRLLIGLALLAAPPGIALLALVVFAGLNPGAALLAGLFCFGVMAALLRPHFVHLAFLARQVRGLAEDDAGGDQAKTPPLPQRSALAGDLDTAIADAVRAWRQRRQIVEQMVRTDQAVIESLPDPLILIGRDRRIVRANPAATAFFGDLSPGRELIAVLRNPALIEAVDAALAGTAGGAGSRVVEFVQPVPVERILSARIAPLPEPAGDGTMVIVSLHDITPIRRAEQLRADFVANASHELRTPLSTLVGFIETLRGPASDDEEARGRFLAIMHEQANRMARLVADLLSLSRIELNEHSAPTGRVEVAALLGNVVDALALKAEQRGMRIEFGSAGDAKASGELATLPPIVGDADELAQVFQNLIDNAIKYGRAGTPIRVSATLVTATAVGGGAGGTRSAPGITRPARPPGWQIAIAIADQGEGIAREHLPRLTERFYRVDAARSRDLGGTGLGLAIVKHIVSRHRGRLEIESEAGKGSIFRVLLPAAS
ncbi:MAG: ATP-binding protein [Rhodospirillaceae bacterium]|nr:ATP-binding protein [Rhodospirillaceae bacterium]